MSAAAEKAEKQRQVEETAAKKLRKEVAQQCIMYLKALDIDCVICHVLGNRRERQSHEMCFNAERAELREWYDWNKPVVKKVSVSSCSSIFFAIGSLSANREAGITIPLQVTGAGRVRSPVMRPIVLAKSTCLTIVLGVTPWVEWRGACGTIRSSSTR
jgi:hypothetical protein